mgnify:CR=1 FL=1
MAFLLLRRTCATPRVYGLAGSLRTVELPTRALPHDDLGVLLGVVAVLGGHLALGELPPDLTRRLVRRLVDHGPLPPGATAGDLTAVLTDVGRRLHWAMSTDLEFPAPMAHRTTYSITVPAGAVAACMTALREAGAQDVGDGPVTVTGWEMRPTGPDGALERHSLDVPDGRTVTATFPELAPDPAYDERSAWLSALAERHGGRCEGAEW